MKGENKMNKQQYKTGDVVIITNPDKDIFSNLKDKVGVVSAIHNNYIYLEMFEPVRFDSGKLSKFSAIHSCDFRFDPDAEEEGKIYFTDPEELSHLTLSEMDAKTMGWLYCIQNHEYIIPTDYFDRKVVNG